MAVGVWTLVEKSGYLGVLASSTFAAIGERYGATVTPVDDLIQTIMLVEQGRVDATINAKGSIDDYLGQHPEANIRIAQILPEGEPVAYPMRKGEDAETLVAAVNDILEAKRQDGTLSAISIKWFGVDQSVLPEGVDPSLVDR